MSDRNSTSQLRSQNDSSLAGELRLVAVGKAIPSERVSNLNRLEEFGIDSAFLREKIGVLHRALKSPTTTVTELCLQAFEDLTRKTSIDLGAIQALCVVTQNPDRSIPHTSAVVQQKLGLSKHCLTFDISQGCAGFTHGIAVVTALVERLGLNEALLFTCDPYSKIVDPNDKGTALIFGDAASVSYFSRSRPGYVLIDADFGTAPNSYECLTCDDQHLRMDGRQVFSNAAREVPDSIRRVMTRHGLTNDHVDRFLLHPGSKYIIDFLRRELNADETKVPFVSAEYGNTVSSSIPIMLQECLLRQEDARLVTCGFGVGFTWGTNLLAFQA
ncbi:ketoacyl-ACP synthase III [Haliangium ochraceum]|uniref:Beta-ketoacyl-acyl-carrier-protein synthase III n=1 Tax=Haliangium ochraceum (strain DSM 14365 / JCM 11303 / SMP-2) TaxID=502025 RepID=D0LPU7_HALO1|nr:ketoacyl-ACP synthase III [Haliangium ochraceum]ACY15460.1 Beta-ketoacyl-acyl-carrier-protein synthase III [Haliangium ochraceum DSM 14365]